jgi:hypothetical protein
MVGNYKNLIARINVLKNAGRLLNRADEDSFVKLDAESDNLGQMYSINTA